MTNYDTRQLVDRYQIKVTDRKVMNRYDPKDYTYNNRHAYEQWQDYVQYESYPMLTMEISETEFEKIASKVCEFDSLLQDPETAKLLMEARFINRLKGNR